MNTGNFLNLNKDTYKTPRANITYINAEIPDAFLVISGKEQKYAIFQLLVAVVEILAGLKKK